MENNRQRCKRDIIKIALTYRYCTKGNEEKRRITFSTSTVKIGILQNKDWIEYGISLADYAIFTEVLTEIENNN